MPALPLEQPDGYFAAMNEMRRTLRICLVSPNGSGELSGLPIGQTGGSEHAQASMARWLAKRGHLVSMITWDEGQVEDAYDGVAVIKMCAPYAGLRGLRFLHPRWTSLYRAMRRADADIYHYQRGDLELGQIVWWCRRHGKRCVYSVASDAACDPGLVDLEPLRERLLYRYGLRRVDMVTVQTHQQRKMMRNGFGIASEVVGTPNDTPSQAGSETKVEGPFRVLWIGRFSKEKCLERLLDVAARLPQIHFDVVGGGNAESDYVAALVQRASQLANVTAHGKVRRDRLGSLYQDTGVLCSTSDHEGFPQIFIEAWRHGVPVVSTVDPDGVISRFGLGRVASGVDGLVSALERLAASPQERGSASVAARTYVLQHCSLEATMSRFERLFLELAPGRHLKTVAPESTHETGALP
jgi:glycosyltransferase involved in cell wall biosynthesis